MNLETPILRTRSISPQILFIATAVLIEFCVTRLPRSRTVEIAAVFDMTVTVTALYYWMVVRRGLRPASSMILVAMLGLFRASLAFPGVVPGRFRIAAGAECAAVFFARDLIFGELAVFYYAFAWWARPEVPAGAETFTLHRKSGFGDLLTMLGLASLLEIVPVHLVLHRWSAPAAWIATGLGIYGTLWCVAIARSLNLRPSYVTADEAVIRFGLLFSLRIPAGAIASVGSRVQAGMRPVPRGSEPNVCIEFTGPLEVRRILGIRGRMSSVALAADEPEALAAALQRMAY
jgi:hypothetical protein